MMRKTDRLRGASGQIPFPFSSRALTLSEDRRSIESDFPVLEISRLAKIESYRKNIYRPIYYIHKWWARRTGAVFRAILLGALLPEDRLPLECFYRANDFRDVVILDPFMGGGTTIGEALRLGAKVVGVDINPVSWFLVKKIVEPISLETLTRTYRYLERTVSSKILSLYETTCPICDNKAQTIYTYWAKRIPCEVCHKPVLLRKSMILARHMSQPQTGLVTCPSCGHPFLTSTLQQEQCCPICAQNFDAQSGLSRGAKYTCPNCSHTGQILDSLKDYDGPPEHEMTCLHYACPLCGKGYKKPDAADLKRWAQIRERFQRSQRQLLYPQVPIPPGYNTNQMIKYNYLFWYQMFNERQLLGLSMLLEAILQIEDRNALEFMLLLFSSVLEFNNIFCSTKGLGTGAVRHLFAHHAYIPAKEPLEANLWGVGRSSGGFSSLFRERLLRGKAYAQQPVERRITNGKTHKVPIPGERMEAPLASSFVDLTTSAKRVFLLNKSSTDLSEIPDDTVDAVVTDPPYWGNVMYSELSDFFYVWLRLGLEKIYPSFSPQSAFREDEAILNPEHGKGAESYQAILGAVFRECHRVLKDDGILIFTFHHSIAEAWDAVGLALREADFMIERLWPIHAEMDVGVPLLGKKGIKFDTILVCRKRRDSSTSAPTLDQGALIDHITQLSRSLIQPLEETFSPSSEDRTCLAHAAATMLYTQGLTDLLPSQFEGKTGDQ